MSEDSFLGESPPLPPSLIADLHAVNRDAAAASTPLEGWNWG